MREEQQSVDLKECRSRHHQGPRLVPVTEFWRRADATDGLQPLCMTCSRISARERYKRARLKDLLKNKRYRIRTDYKPSQELRKRQNLRKKERTLEERRKKAQLLTALVAEEYGYYSADLLGPSRGANKHLDEAKGVVTRLIRRFTFLGPEEIAQILNCSPQTVTHRLKVSYRWIRHDLGDIRVVERIHRIVKKYRSLVPSRREERRRRNGDHKRYG